MCIGIKRKDFCLDKSFNAFERLSWGCMVHVNDCNNETGHCSYIALLNAFLGSLYKYCQLTATRSKRTLENSIASNYLIVYHSNDSSRWRNCGRKSTAFIPLPLRSGAGHLVRTLTKVNRRKPTSKRTHFSKLNPHAYLALTCNCSRTRFLWIRSLWIIPLNTKTLYIGIHGKSWSVLFAHNTTVPRDVNLKLQEKDGVQVTCYSWLVGTYVPVLSVKLLF